MKTITMYELLGLVKDGKAPKKIKYNNKIYNYETFNIGKGDNYFTAEWEEEKGYRISYDGTYYYLKISDYNLNDEVEILEEEPYVEVCGSWFTKSEYDKLFLEEEKKIPEKLTDILIVDDLVPPVNENMYKIWEQTIKNHNKINEICDYLKSKGE